MGFLLRRGVESWKRLEGYRPFGLYARNGPSTLIISDSSGLHITTIWILSFLRNAQSCWTSGNRFGPQRARNARVFIAWAFKWSTKAECRSGQDKARTLKSKDSQVAGLLSLQWAHTQLRLAVQFDGFHYHAVIFFWNRLWTREDPHCLHRTLPDSLTLVWRRPCYVT